MISVIIPTYNRAHLLRQMIVSIMQMEAVEMEIIVIDDKSDDNTSDIVKSLKDNNVSDFDIFYLKAPRNLGPGKCRKIGFDLSKGKYIVFADDDDYYVDSQFFKKATDILSENPTIVGVSGNCDILYTDTGYIQSQKLPFTGYINGKQYLSKFMIEYPKPLSTFSTVFSKNALKNVGLANMKMVNDAAIFMRAFLYGDFTILSDTIGVYRIHDSNITKNLSSEFIIENLCEKYNVYKMAGSFGLNLSPQWIKDQFNLTESYYFKNSLYGLRDVIRIHLWGIRHKTSSFKRLISRILK